MDLSGVISISGKPGLFKVVAQSKNNIIVESLIDNKRIPAYSTDRISALEDISIYTYEEDVPLKEVYIKLAKKEDCKAGPSHKESLNTLTSYLEEILPDYDQDRVYPSDIKKLFQWYNILQKAGLISLEEEKKEETKEVEAKEEVAEKETKKAEDKKPAAKKPAAKKTEAKKETVKKSAPKKEKK
ncbi:hypothetical protein ERX46_13595 [Brumimicrobium glaciale]|jgi:hypothetical protein|uniref:Uncharacterized protein n=1 Tax=Brumimicrobium glaciale TaxID=200475 RepID=A0A4Q4KJ79_9FLAO|nr:DUF5606 domain-containing protein [Brumimicrobium glaciale]RYM32314.1 hypothetical protein ERX46_13595 [Brumimicrobium glaciale]